MIYLKFHACLSWPKSAAEVEYEADSKRADYPARERERFATCGLAPAFSLSAYVLPRLLKGNIDADGEEDLLAPITRLSDGKHGVAVCRNGTVLHVLGLSGKVGDALPAAYFDQIESWRLVPEKPEKPAKIGNIEADSRRHNLIIERIEKSSYMIFWDGKKFESRLNYRHSEAD